MDRRSAESLARYGVVEVGRADDGFDEEPAERRAVDLAPFGQCLSGEVVERPIEVVDGDIAVHQPALFERRPQHIATGRVAPFIEVGKAIPRPLARTTRKPG